MRTFGVSIADRPPPTHPLASAATQTGTPNETTTIPGPCPVSCNPTPPVENIDRSIDRIDRSFSSGHVSQTPTIHNTTQTRINATPKMMIRAVCLYFDRTAIGSQFDRTLKSATTSSTTTSSTTTLLHSPPPTKSRRPTRSTRPAPRCTPVHHWRTRARTPPASGEY